MADNSLLANRLIYLYKDMLENRLGLPGRMARKGARQIIREAKEQSQKSGTRNLDYNWCREVRKGNVGYEGWVKYFDLAFKEGVKEEDFKWWWDMHDLERHAMLQMDEYIRFASFIGHRKNGLSPEEASIRVLKTHPVYGFPKEDNLSKGDDISLPFELRDRVNLYVENMAKENPETYKEKMQFYSTFNALIRAAIREGKLNRTDY